MGDHAPKQWPERAKVGAATSEPRTGISHPADGTFSPTIGAIDATDAARDLATEHDIDLATVTGTGVDGRITKDDVQAVVDQQD